MQPKQYLKSYRDTAIATATPGQLILMLFDGALRSMAIALSGFKEGGASRRNEQIHNKIVNAQEILRELQISLDMKVPGGFSQRMWSLYDFMIGQLQKANLSKEPEPIRIVERLLRKIRDAWAEMLERSTNQIAA
jgi:flagellar protein FliS